MFGAQQINRLAGTVSSARFGAFPCKMTYRGLPGSCVATGLKTGGTLQEAGFHFTHDCIARIPLAVAPAANPPKIGEQITLFLPGGPVTGQPLRIDEILAHPVNPEWRLGLGRL